MDDIFDVEVVKTEDIEVLMIMELDGIAYAQLFSDLTDQLGIYLAGFEALPIPFDEDWNCTVPDCEEPDFSNVIAALTQVGMSEMHMLMDPSNPTWMEMGLDLTEFIQFLVDNGEYPPTINDASITITIQDSADIATPDPAETAVVNDVVQDLAKFAMTAEAYEILKDYAFYYEMNPNDLLALYNTNVFLSDIDFLDFSAAFDLEASYITISVDEIMGVPDPLSLDYEVVLFWIDGTPVFDGPVGLADIAPLWLDGNLQSQAGYDTMVDMIDDTNWEMTRLFLYYLFQPEDDYYEEY